MTRLPFTRRASISRVVVALLVGIVVAGCLTNPFDPTPPPPVAGASELRPTGSPLSPGRYTRSAFEPSLTFEVGESWHAGQMYAGFFDIQQDVDSPDVIAVQFVRPTEAFGAEGGAEPASPADAVEILSANPGLTVIEISDSEVGGLTGSQVTVANEGEDHATVMSVAAGTFGINPGRRLWIAFFDTDAGLLAIMVGGSTERWEEALTTAEPVLESIRFED